MWDGMHAETRADGIAVLTFDAPGRPVNVLSPEFRAAFVAEAGRLLDDPQVRGLILTSGKDSFVAGADLRYFQSLRRKPLDEVAEAMALMRGFLRRMEQCGKPVVAALPGTALGGGLEIALACTARVAADTPGARYGLPEVTLGLLPGAGGTQRLPRMIGLEPALDLILAGRRMSGAEALKLGILDELVPADDLLQAAVRRLDGITDPTRPWDKPGFAAPGLDVGSATADSVFAARAAAVQAETRGNFPAPEAILACIRDGLGTDIDTGLQIEIDHMLRLMTGDVAQNTIRTFFFNIAEARKARSRPEGAPLGLSRLGILGGGTMGAGIAEVAALNGLDVVLVERDEPAAAAARDRIAGSMGKLVDRGRMAAATRDDAMARIATGADFSALKGVQAVIEAVFEDREVKRLATEQALAVTGPDILFGSNTSKIPITGLAANTPRPDRFIGLHFFSPVPRMELLEIIRGAETSDETLAHALDLSRALKRVPIVVNDGPGFFTSRCVSTFIGEGFALLRDGVIPSEIERVGKASGMPAGPLMLADGVGLDLMLAVRKQEMADRGTPDQVSPEMEVLQSLVSQGRTGRKSGAGFYDYGKDGTALWPGLAGHWPPANDQPDADTIRRRLLHIQAIEAAKCFEDGVIDRPETADIGSVLGWSFARHTGGVCSYVDMIGVPAFVAECRALAETAGPRFTPPALLERMAAEGRSFYEEA